MLQRDDISISEFGDSVFLNNQFSKTDQVWKTEHFGSTYYRNTRIIVSDTEL